MTAFKSQFVSPQTRRDDDADKQWWRLPDDATRRSSAWHQLVADLRSPAPFSAWHARVVKDRVAIYDRLRYPVTRAVMLTAIVTVLLLVGASWWLMTITLWAALLQVALEIYLEPYALKPELVSRLSWTNQMAELVRENQPSLLVNVTGILGTFACMLNVVAIAFAPSGGELGWLKVAGLAAAVVYGNTCLANFFLDPANYSERSTMPPFVHAVRPYASLIALVFVTGVVAWSADNDHWQADMVPLAFLSALLTLHLGTTIRNHDRMLSAAVPTAREAINDGREDLVTRTHNEMNSVRGQLRELQKYESVPLTLRAQLSSIPAIVTHLFETTRLEHASAPLPLRDLAKKILDEYQSTKHAAVTYRIEWNDVPPKHHDAAEKVVAALCLNVAQAIARNEYPDCSTDLTIEAYTFGEGRDLGYVVAVHDHLPFIRNFCPPGKTSLTSLRTMLREQYDGDLTQVADDARLGKAIVARWSDRTPAIKIGDEPDFDYAEEGEQL